MLIYLIFNFSNQEPLLLTLSFGFLFNFVILSDRFINIFLLISLVFPLLLYWLALLLVDLTLFQLFVIPLSSLLSIILSSLFFFFLSSFFRPMLFYFLANTPNKETWPLFLVIYFFLFGAARVRITLVFINLLQTFVFLFESFSILFALLFELFIPLLFGLLLLPFRVPAFLLPIFTFFFVGSRARSLIWRISQDDAPSLLNLGHSCMNNFFLDLFSNFAPVTRIFLFLSFAPLIPLLLDMLFQPFTCNICHYWVYQIQLYDVEKEYTAVPLLENALKMTQWH